MILVTEDPRVNLTNGQFAAGGNIGDNDGTVITSYNNILSENANVLIQH